MNKNKQNKALAAVLATSILVTGTFAWQSFSQLATNETITHGGLAGGRLHNYFFQGDEGTTGYDRVQEVFVENYAGVKEYDEDGNSVTSSNPNEFSSAIYARVRLSEYLEYGFQAGYLPTELSDDDFTKKDSEVTKVRGTNPDMSVTPEIDDESTWDVYKWDTDSAIQQYRTLEFGGMNGNAGSTAYMPTFNQDHTSDETQLNGSLKGTGPDRHTEATAYLDYTFYEDGDLGSGVLDFYNLDDDQNDYTDDEVYHKAQPTEVSTGVISMEDWLKSPTPGDFWVYDEDGWAYWANPIVGDSATGLLLSGITEEKTVDGTATYYAVHVEAQLATAGAWENEDELSDILGMEGDNITGEGLFLLNLISSETDVFAQPTTTLTSLLNQSASDINALVGTDTTINVEGMDYYVLESKTLDTYYKEDVIYGTTDAVLLWAAEFVEIDSQYNSAHDIYGKATHQVPFHNEVDSKWSTSDMRTKVLPSWLGATTQTKALALTTKVTTDGYYTVDSSEMNVTGDCYEETYDTSYLLSKNEFVDGYNLVGTSRAKSTTVNTFFVDNTQSSTQYAWLRSPASTGAGLVVAQHTGYINANPFLVTLTTTFTEGCGVRPALWVAL